MVADSPQWVPLNGVDHGNDHADFDLARNDKRLNGERWRMTSATHDSAFSQLFPQRLLRRAGRPFMSACRRILFVPCISTVQAGCAGGAVTRLIPEWSRRWSHCACGFAVTTAGWQMCAAVARQLAAEIGKMQSPVFGVGGPVSPLPVRKFVR